jgi:hypothetical protein
MRSSIFGFLALASHSLAAPFPIQAWQASTTFGNKATQLDQDLSLKWYDHWSVENSNNPPQNPKAFYACTGPDMSAFPSKGKWLSFNTLWDLNKEQISIANNYNEDYIGYIQDAIKSVSQASKIDSRIILAMIMQEVRVPSAIPQYLLTVFLSPLAKCILSVRERATPIAGSFRLVAAHALILRTRSSPSMT